MIFKLLRIAFLAIILWCSFFLIKRADFKKKKALFFLAILLCFVISSITFSYPLENVFYSFKTPEAAFKYSQVGQIESIQEGKQSCGVLYCDTRNSHHIIAFEKDENGYKIPVRGQMIQTEKSEISKNGYFQIYSFDKGADYYLFGRVYGEEELSICDKNGNVLPSKTEKSYGTNYATVFLHIENYNDDYCIYINGGKLCF